jgi:hypothetical protein
MLAMSDTAVPLMPANSIDETVLMYAMPPRVQPNSICSQTTSLGSICARSARMPSMMNNGIASSGNELSA